MNRTYSLSGHLLVLALVSVGRGEDAPYVFTSEPGRPTLVSGNPREILNEIDRLNGAIQNDAGRPSGSAVAGHGTPHAEFELVPSRPGPYGSVGVTIDIDVWIHSLDDTDRELRLIQFDAMDTDAAISLPGTFTFDFSALNDGGGSYFDYHGILSGAGGFAFGLAYTLLGPAPGTMLVLPAHGSLHVGRFEGVTLPSAPGTYSFDVLNADAAGSDFGAQLRSGFGVLEGDPLVRWRAYTGEIIGDPLELIVAAAECLSGADCDDGVFCNGRERCTITSECRPARRLPCAPEWCIEEIDYCRRPGDSATRRQVAPERKH